MYKKRKEHMSSKWSTHRPRLGRSHYLFQASSLALTTACQRSDEVQAKFLLSQIFPRTVA